MRTNIVIDDRLMTAALQATGLPTKRAVVEAGLKMLVRLHAQESFRRHRGEVAWEGDLDEMRQGRFAES
jgi:Arc/MetJ family transcription regulator